MSNINLPAFAPATHIVIGESGIPIAVINIHKKQEHEVAALIREAIDEHTGEGGIIDIDLNPNTLVVSYESYRFPAEYEAYPVWLYE